MLEKLIELDTKLFLFLNSLNNDFFDAFMHFVSGRFEWIPFYALVIGYVIYVFRKKSLLIIPLIILLITLADQTSVHWFKEVFVRLRPCHNPEIQHMIHLVNDHCGGRYGFISSHATNTFALAGFISLLFNRKWISILMFSWCTIVSYSRIYLGVHYPGDVLGGAAWGFLLSYAIYRVYVLLEIYLFQSKKA